MFHEEKPTTVRLWKNRAERRQENMKHILPILTAALAFAATNLFGADVYDLEQIMYTNEQNQGMGQGSYYKLKLNSNSKIYLLDHLNNIYSGSQTETLGAMGITQYGYYLNGDKTDAHATTLGSNVTSFDSYNYYDEEGKQTYNRNAYYLGDFKAGSEIEIWMSDGTTTVGTWTPVEGAYTSRFLGRTDALNKEISVAQLTMYASTGNQVNFGLFTAASDIPATEGGTVGSPLPGGLQIALIAGLFGLGFWYVRRRKTIAA